MIRIRYSFTLVLFIIIPPIFASLHHEKASKISSSICLNQYFPEGYLGVNKANQKTLSSYATCLKRMNKKGIAQQRIYKEKKRGIEEYYGAHSMITITWCVKHVLLGIRCELKGPFKAIKTFPEYYEALKKLHDLQENKENSSKPI